jgi:hypothetical protein
MRCVSICTFVLHYCITAAAGLEVDAADAQELHAVRQYLYFCTALLVQKYKYWRTCCRETTLLLEGRRQRRLPLLGEQVRQYLYFCTSNAVQTYKY